MSSRIEQAKLAVDQLLRNQPTIILDNGTLNGKKRFAQRARQFFDFKM